MKRYLSNVFTVFVSGALIASTLFFTGFGTFEASQNKTPIENTVSAKSGNHVTPDDLTVSKINIDRIFDKYMTDDFDNNNNSEANNDGESDLTTVPPVLSSQTDVGSAISAPASSSADTTAASVSSTVSSTTKTSAATTTSTVKAPEDESKNIQYIKDPDYKSKYYVVVYTGSQSVVVYGKDDSGAYNVKIKTFTVSTGRTKSTPTREGVYKIRAKYRWRMLMGPCWGQYCSSISSSYLFHSVPYDKKSPDTLYNASYNNLGKAVSHGCIRMCVRDCKWIYDNCPIGTQVHVVWASGPAGPGVPKRKSGSKYSGWDPSDQWSKGNPYFADGADNETTTKTTTKTTTSTTATTSSTTAASSSTANSSTSMVTAAKSSSTAAPPQTTKASSQQTTAKPSDYQSDSSDEVPVG